MSSLDPRLAYISRAGAEIAEHIGLSISGGAAPRVRVLVRFHGEPTDLSATGFVVAFTDGAVVAGEVPVANLAQLAAISEIANIEGTFELTHQLSSSVPAIKANQVHTGPPPYKGQGVIVGVIDSGFDYTHDCFRKADGTSRMLFLWDQFGAPAGTFTAPTGFTAGVEYTKANLDAALAAGAPLSVVPHQDSNHPKVGGHGTHVLGIAAGNGRASGGGDAANTFVGVAPEADIIAVAAMDPAITRFSSNNVLAACAYIFQKAEALRRPCVINISIGGPRGPLDGSTSYERKLDEFLDGTPGRALVIAAGNSGDWNVHATGRLTTGTATRLSVAVGANSGVTVEFWYSSRDRIRYTVTDPNGNVTPPITDTGPIPTHPIGGISSVGGQVDLDLSENHQNRLYVVLSGPPIAAGGTGPLTAGNWHIDITPTTLADGRFHAWVFARNTPRFTTLTGAPYSLTNPGSAREAITVANWDVASNALNASSGRGPTVDGRTKPEVAAPGTNIKAPRANNVAGGTPYQVMSGTSMAAPHVAGAIALVFQRYPTLIASQIRRGIEATSRADADTGAVPNNDWGYGKLDTKALVDRVYPQPLTQNWIRIQPRMANWAMGASPPIFDVSAQECGDAVIELAWDPAALITPSSGHTGLNAMRYYTTFAAFDKTITKADGSSLHVVVPAQTIRLTANRATWTMPVALWDAYKEEATRSLRTPPTSTFSRNLYYRVRVTPIGASEAIAWPPDSAIQANPDAPHMGLIRVSEAPAVRAIPDPAAVAQMGGIPGHPDTWARLLTELWNDLPEADPERQALARVFAHAAFTNELTVLQRGRLLTLWLFAGPASRRRLPELLDRRVWISQTESRPAVAGLDRTRTRTLTENLLALTHLVPHRDIVGVLAPEQLVDDVLTEVLDPNGRINRGNAYTGVTCAVQAMLITVNPSEYVRLLHGLLGQAGVVNLSNGQNVEVPAGVFQFRRYAAGQTDSLYVRTYAELAFQTAMLAYGVGPTFPRADPAAAPESPTGVAAVFRQTLRTGLTMEEQRRVLQGLFNTPFTSVFEAPSATLRDRLLAAVRDSRVPVPLVLNWPDTATAPTTGLAAALALRYDAGRLFFKNPQYPGSNPPAVARVGATVDQPPRRYEDPESTLESMGDSDLTTWVRGFLTPNASIL